MYSMATRESLVGQVFHDLTVVGEAPNVGGRPASLCLCSCGQECIKKNKYLKNGDTKSCGHRYADQKQPDFLPGEIFQKLTILEKLPQEKGKKPRYLVQCECGNVVEKYRSCVLRDETCGACKSFSYIGKKIDRLTILEYLGTDELGQLIYSAVCDCGTERTITYNALQKNKFNSCSDCYHTWANPLDNLSGQVFGRLTVQYLWQARPNLWLSICECGKSCLHSKGELTTGNVQSCGCLNLEVARMHMLEYLSTRVVLRGEDSPSWKGGLTPLKMVIRTSDSYKNWRLSVFERDEFTCQDCGQLRGDIQAHHIEHFSTILYKYNITTMDEALACPTLWDIDNGVTVCISCHANRHPDVNIFNTLRKSKG